eukprot:TRINITY_DN1127_c0_g1_i5.p1 TRINITY_DN1127_c0_g1~~TRINITY_DN1127_c0_g1_i5.p1  ORF type:complete len:107 (+),score=40.56 TRINITY_DN1127_c0_g1_i5:96-416(+)
MCIRDRYQRRVRGSRAKKMAQNVNDLKQGIQQQLQQQQLQTIVGSMSNLCFKKCVDTPGSRLSSSEQRCLSQCVDRFMDTMMAVQESFVQQAQQQQASGGANSNWR